ncbi:MAG: hypothetical protein QGH44_05800 [Arenicellales bacterium]|nr:hypothetical protein [Arenicellales bacterium]
MRELIDNDVLDDRAGGRIWFCRVCPGGGRGKEIDPIAYRYRTTVKMETVIARPPQALLPVTDRGEVFSVHRAGYARYNDAPPLKSGRDLDCKTLWEG